MEGKRKINYRRVLQAFTTLVVTVGCVVAMVGASRIEDRKTLKSVVVNIRNSKKYHFVQQNEVLHEAITARNLDIMHIPLGRLDLQSMERALRKDPWVQEAQVYLDNDSRLNITITQRLPVARLFFNNGGSCYMDSSLNLMPLTTHSIFYTTVVTNVPAVKSDSLLHLYKAQILKVCKNIQADSFWNAQITQVIVDSLSCFEMVPVLGNQRIILGDTSRIGEKLANLFAFYNKVLNRIGWDKYESLDLRYRDQVVASPSLPYHGPQDKVVEKMNWIASIVATEAKNEAVDTTSSDDQDDQAASAPVKPAEVKPDKAATKPPDHSKEKKKPDKQQAASKDKKKGKKPPG